MRVCVNVCGHTSDIGHCDSPGALECVSDSTAAIQHSDAGLQLTDIALFDCPNMRSLMAGGNINDNILCAVNVQSICARGMN